MMASHQQQDIPGPHIEHYTRMTCMLCYCNKELNLLQRKDFATYAIQAGLVILQQ